jgi:serine/threonine protein kinase
MHGGKRSKTLAQVLKSDDEQFIDFIARCLTWDPDRRLRPQTALRHPFCRRELRAPPVSTSTPARTSKVSVGATPSSAVISAPRRKQATAGLSTPQVYNNVAGPSSASTAPVQRISTSSSLYKTAFGSSTSLNRFPVKSNIWYVRFSSSFFFDGTYSTLNLLYTDRSRRLFSLASFYLACLFLHPFFPKSFRVHQDTWLSTIHTLSTLPTSFSLPFLLHEHCERNQLPHLPYFFFNLSGQASPFSALTIAYVTAGAGGPRGDARPTRRRTVVVCLFSVLFSLF